MELSTIKLHSVLQRGRAESQITLDDDYNVPDYRPDIVKVIREQGNVRIEEVKPAAGAVWVKGKLLFAVLYRSDQENGKISCLKGELPFQEKINMEGISEYDAVRVMGEIEDLTIGVIHSRKLNVRAVIVLCSQAQVPSVEETADGAETEEECMQLRKPIEVSQQLFAKRDVCRQKNEIALPSSKPNIREILWKSVELRNVGSRLDSEGIHLTGEILLSILYQEEEEPDRIQWYETTLPLECGTDFEMERLTGEDLFYKIQIEEIGKELEVKPDYDGEERMLVLELLLHVSVRLWQETKLELLEDLYSLKQNLIPERGTVHLEHLLIKNEAVCKVVEPMELMENQEKILQICSCEGTAHVDRMEKQPGGVFVEGTLTVNLMYITTDDHMPVGAVERIYPFEQFIEIPTTEGEVRLEQECNIVQLSASMLDQSHAEIKAVISIGVLAFSMKEVERIVSVKEEPLAIEEVQKIPGLVGYIVKNGDTLWSIAKQYHTTTEALMQQNQKKDETIKAGEKLLIVKEM